jgi:hypothetical protein
MPCVQTVRGELRDLAIELTRKAEAEGAGTWDIAYRHGFFKALGHLLPSETVGMLVMDCDCALAGDDLYTDTLPRLALRQE